MEKEENEKLDEKKAGKERIRTILVICVTLVFIVLFILMGSFGEIKDASKSVDDKMEEQEHSVGKDESKEEIHGSSRSDVIDERGQTEVPREKSFLEKKFEQEVGESKFNYSIYGVNLLDLYHEVSGDFDGQYFNYVYGKEHKKEFVVSDATEEDKMRLVGRLLVPDVNSVKAQSITSGEACEMNRQLFAIEKVESIYKQLFGQNAQLDTSAVITIGEHGLLKLHYNQSTATYYPCFSEGGGMYAGKEAAKLVNADNDDSHIYLYQEVIEYDGDGIVIDFYQLVYTFEKENGNYKFISMKAA